MRDYSVYYEIDTTRGGVFSYLSVSATDANDAISKAIKILRRRRTMVRIASVSVVERTTYRWCPLTQTVSRYCEA